MQSKSFGVASGQLRKRELLQPHVRPPLDSLMLLAGRQGFSWGRIHLAGDLQRGALGGGVVV